MWVQANHAKTGWRRDIKYGNGETGEWVKRGLRRFAHSPIRRFDLSSVLRRFKLGEFLLGAIDIGLSCDAELKKLLLPA
jgi:hypothetical protein